jgi:hypothetical protein
MFKLVLKLAYQFSGSGIAPGKSSGIVPSVDAEAKTRENKVRRLAKRRGLELQRHRARDTGHVLYGTYQITRPDGSVVAAKEHPAFGRSYGLTLDEAGKILLEGGGR